MKDPLSAEVADVRGRDFGEIAEAAAGVVAIVGDPVCSGRLDEQIFGPHIDGGGNDVGGFLLPMGERGAAQKDGGERDGFPERAEQGHRGDSGYASHSSSPPRGGRTASQLLEWISAFRWSRTWNAP